jgi:hypothetical protein
MMGDEWQPCSGNGCVGGLITYYDPELGAERSVVCSQCDGSGTYFPYNTEGGE